MLRFNGRVLFVKDVLGDEICCWSFYGEGRKIAEVCCTSIVYATEKKQTKVSAMWNDNYFLKQILTRRFVNVVQLRFVSYPHWQVFTTISKTLYVTTSDDIAHGLLEHNLKFNDNVCRRMWNALRFYDKSGYTYLIRHRNTCNLFIVFLCFATWPHKYSRLQFKYATLFVKFGWLQFLHSESHHIVYPDYQAS